MGGVVGYAAPWERWWLYFYCSDVQRQQTAHPPGSLKHGQRQVRQSRRHGAAQSAGSRTAPADYGAALQHMNEPLSQRQVRIGVLADRQINAANAGGGEFYVTTGLLDQASDDELRGVMAHEIAHADLHHVSKLQTRDRGWAWRPPWLFCA